MGHGFAVGGVQDTRGRLGFVLALGGTLAVGGCGSSIVGADGDADGGDIASADGEGSDEGHDADGPDEDDEAGDGPYVCHTIDINWPPIEKRLAFVLDTSSRVAEVTYDADGDPLTTDPITLWKGLHEIVAAIVTETEATTWISAQRFPAALPPGVTSFTSACAVESTPEVPLGQANGQVTMAALPPPEAIACPSPPLACASPEDRLFGAAPATLAIASMVAHLNARQVGSYAGTIVLIIGGPPNCMPQAVEDGWAGDGSDAPAWFDTYDPGLIATLHAAREMGIDTFVIGVGIDDAATPSTPYLSPDGVNPVHALSQAALAGGRPRQTITMDPLDGDPEFYSPYDLDDLLAALTSSLWSPGGHCGLVLDPGPTPEQLDKGWIEVEVAGEVAGFLDAIECGASDGWIVLAVDEHTIEIELCGVPCDVFQETGQVTIRYLCQAPP